MARTELLQAVQIAKPCPANWEEMKGDDTVRHCSLCKLNVYNISGMTSAEAEKLLAEASGRLCIRMYRRSDGKVMTADCPKGLMKVRKKLALCLAAIATSLLGVGSNWIRTGEDHTARWAVQDVAPLKRVLDWIDPLLNASATMGDPVATSLPPAASPKASGALMGVRAHPVAPKRQTVKAHAHSHHKRRRSRRSGHSGAG